MAHMSVPCHEGPPATKGHFSSEPAVAGRGRYYCSLLCFKSIMFNLSIGGTTTFWLYEACLSLAVYMSTFQLLSFIIYIVLSLMK